MSQQVPQSFKRGMRSKEKKASDQISGAKNNPRKESLLYVEDDMRVPFCSSGINVSKAAQDQKKNEVARNQGVKKIQEERFQYPFEIAQSGIHCLLSAK